MSTDIHGAESDAITLRIFDLPEDLIGSIACFLDTRTICAFNSTCTQFRKFYASVKLTKEASQRHMFEHELRDRIQTRLVLPYRNIYICVDVPSLVTAFINIESCTWLELKLEQVSDASLISHLTSLKYLDVSDISAIAGLTNLTNLNLSYTQSVASPT